MITVTTTSNEEPRIAASIAEWARRIGVSAGLIRLEIARGKLKTARVGRRVVILADEIERYLHQGGK